MIQHINESPASYKGNIHNKDVIKEKTAIMSTYNL